MKTWNWERQLIEWADRQVGRPFAWGQTDCCALAHGALALLHHAGPALPVYRDRASAAAVIAHLGGAEGVAAWLGALGGQSGELGLIQHGDIVIRPVPDPAQLPVQVFIFVSGRLVGADIDAGVRWYDIAALQRAIADDPVPTFAWRLP